MSEALSLRTAPATNTDNGGIKVYYVFILYVGLFFFVPKYLELSVQGIRLNPHRVLGLFLYIYIIYAMVKGYGRLEKYSFFFFAFYFAWSLVSVILNSGDQRSYFLWVDDLLSCGVFFYMGSNLSRSDTRHFGTVVSFSGVLLSLIVLLEFFTKFNIFTLVANPDTTIGQVALNETVRDGVYRAKGPFEHPLVVATVLSMVFSFVFLLGKNFLSIVCALLIVLAVYSTQTRSGMLAVVASVAVLLVIYLFFRIRRDPLNVFFWAVMVSLAALVVLYLGFAAAFLGGDSELSSTLTRLDQFTVGLALLEQQPWFGYGFGNASISLLEQRIVNIQIYNNTIDSLYLSVPLESGIPALLAFAAFCLSGFVPALRVLAGPWNGFVSIFYGCCTAALVSAVVCFAVLSIHTSLPLLFLFVGLLASASRDRSIETDNSSVQAR